MFVRVRGAAHFRKIYIPRVERNKNTVDAPCRRITRWSKQRQAACSCLDAEEEITSELFAGRKVILGAGGRRRCEPCIRWIFVLLTLQRST